jgi:hypothetical protein
MLGIANSFYGISHATPPFSCFGIMPGAASWNKSAHKKTRHKGRVILVWLLLVSLIYLSVSHLARFSRLARELTVLDD